LSETINVAKLKIFKFMVQKKLLSKMKNSLLVVLFKLGLKNNNEIRKLIYIHAIIKDWE
jgi:hypothetical protein